MNPIANYMSILEIIFALNALTYFCSIEPRRRGELLELYRQFRLKIPDFNRRDREAVRGYFILVHYGAALLLLTTLSFIFAAIAIGLMLYGAVDPTAMVDSVFMVPGMLVMLTLVPFGSIWVTLFCKTQFEHYLSEIEQGIVG